MKTVFPLVIAIFSAISGVQASDPVPADAWNFAEFREGAPLSGLQGRELVPHGAVTSHGTGADFLDGGYLELKENFHDIAGDTFSVVAEVEQVGPVPATYGTVFFAHPAIVLRLWGKKLEASCDGDWHAIGGDASSISGRISRVAATFDGTTYKLYLDGELLGERAASVDPKESPLLLVGGRPKSDSGGGSDSQESFPGQIRWLKIYNSALTPEQIAAIK
jgi:hypothetical protein